MLAGLLAAGVAGGGEGVVQESGDLEQEWPQLLCFPGVEGWRGAHAASLTLCSG